MTELYTRALIALLAAGILLNHARRAPLDGMRRRALSIGGVGALLIGAANLLQALLPGVTLVPALFLGGSAAFIGAIVLLAIAYRRGEFSEQFARMREATAEERRRRAIEQSEQNQR